MIVDQLRSCIGSPEMKESEDPSPVGLALYVGTESEKKSQMRKWGQFDVTGPTFPLQAREEGDDWGPVSCQETRVG